MVTEELDPLGLVQVYESSRGLGAVVTINSFVNFIKFVITTGIS